MRMQLLWPLWMVAAVVLWGCADLEQAVRQQPQAGTSAGLTSASTNTLIGKDRTSLLRQHGYPDRIFDIGGNREAYVYTKRQGSGCTDAYVVNANGRIVSYYCR